MTVRPPATGPVATAQTGPAGIAAAGTTTTGVPDLAVDHPAAVRGAGPEPPRVRTARQDVVRRPLVRLYVAVAVTAIAFAAPLLHLAHGFRFASATGELVAVPVVVIVLLHVTIGRQDGLWNGRLGHGDHVGAGLAALAAAVLLVVPSGEFNDRALTRLDVLAMPLALTASLILLLGLRVLVVAAFPLVYALLVWPYPWTLAESGVVGSLAGLTYRVAGRAAELAGTAQVVAASGENVLRVGSGDNAFEIAVAPACSGLGGLVAFAIVGGAALFFLRPARPGSREAVRKVAWVAAGLTLTWAATVVRVVLLTAVGVTWGEEVALGVLHPVAGLVLDALVFVVMLAAAGRFGLRLAAPGASPAAAEGRRYPLPAARPVLLRIGLVSVLGAVFLALNLFVDGGARPAAAAGAVHRPMSLGVLHATDPEAAYVGSQGWSRPYFGRDSTWRRYRTRTEGTPAATTWIDSIVVRDPDALAAHPVAECYAFHRAQILRRTEVRVADGVRATAVAVRRAEGDVWYSLHWQWPVLVGTDLRYERVVLMTAQPLTTTAVRVSGDVDRVPVPVDPAVLDRLRATAGRVLGGTP